MTTTVTRSHIQQGLQSALTLLPVSLQPSQAGSHLFFTFSPWTSRWALDEPEKPLRCTHWRAERTALGRAEQDEPGCRGQMPAVDVEPLPPLSLPLLCLVQAGCLGTHLLSSRSSWSGMVSSPGRGHPPFGFGRGFMGSETTCSLEPFFFLKQDEE